MSDSRPVIRVASTQNYGAQSVTAIAFVRDKIETPCGNLMKSKNAKTTKETMELENDSFADVGLAANI